MLVIYRLEFSWSHLPQPLSRSFSSCRIVTQYYTYPYIRCEMTPTSLDGEQQISISGGSQSPIRYSLWQDCRDAQKKYVMHCMTRISQQECRGILEKSIMDAPKHIFPALFTRFSLHSHLHRIFSSINTNPRAFTQRKNTETISSDNFSVSFISHL